MAQNKLIPEYKNPPPPPPLTDEGKKWASYHFHKLDEWQEEKEDLQEWASDRIITAVCLSTLLALSFAACLIAYFS